MSGNSKALRVEETLFSRVLKGPGGKHCLSIITVRLYPPLPPGGGRGERVQDKETATGAAVAGRVTLALI